MTTPTKKVGVREARAKLPALIDQVTKTGKPVTVTWHGEEMVNIVPSESGSATSGLPRIIALASLKGGVGKTTVAMHLAASIAKEHADVVILDADEEVSAVRWQQHAANAEQPLPFQVIAAQRNLVMRQARELANAGHVVIIDTPPNNREMLKTAATVADMVLVPVLPTLLDVDRLGTTLELLEDLAAGLPQLNYAILLNRFDGRKSLSHAANAALEDHPRLEAVIRNLSAYEKVFGTAPAELGEFDAVWREIKGALGGD